MTLLPPPARCSHARQALASGVNPRLAGIRVGSVEGLPNHLVFYRQIEGGIVVIRVLHGARDIDSVFAADDG
jgi:plasmid stabilization system protein ParE